MSHFLVSEEARVEAFHDGRLVHGYANDDNLLPSIAKLALEVLPYLVGYVFLLVPVKTCPPRPRGTDIEMRTGVTPIQTCMRKVVQPAKTLETCTTSHRVTRKEEGCTAQHSMSGVVSGVSQC